MKKKTLKPSAQDLKIQFLLVKTLQKKIYNRNMDLLISNCFQNQFWTSGSGQTVNTRKYVFAYFQFDHFPKSKIDFESSFEMRRSIFLL